MGWRGLAACLAGMACGCGAAAAAAPHPHAREHLAIRGWRIDIARDAFSGTTGCRLASRNGRIRYAPGALGFVFARGLSTLDAVYRIDGGPALRWAESYPALIAAGVPVDGPGLDNPTDGIVWLPLDRLTGARELRIRPDARHRPARFVVTGFADALAAARARGCLTDPAFGP